VNPVTRPGKAARSAGATAAGPSGRRTYDPQSDTFYQGIGNAGPDFDTEYRPGDNKWAASVLAISPNDGKIKRGYQYTPNDPMISTRFPNIPLLMRNQW
jgi:glucose dehydrogenase